MSQTTQKKRLKHLLATPKREKRGPIELPLFTSAPAVTVDDIETWIAATAPHISPLRRARYAIDYDVANKITRAKLAGQWPPTPQGT